MRQCTYTTQKLHPFMQLIDDCHCLTVPGFVSSNVKSTTLSSIYFFREKLSSYACTDVLSLKTLSLSFLPVASGRHPLLNQPDFLLSYSNVVAISLPLTYLSPPSCQNLAPAEIHILPPLLVFSQISITQSPSIWLHF